VRSSLGVDGRCPFFKSHEGSRPSGPSAADEEGAGAGDALATATTLAEGAAEAAGAAAEVVDVGGVDAVDAAAISPGFFASKVAAEGTP
jgi:hypothetical protein